MENKRFNHISYYFKVNFTFQFINKTFILKIMLPLANISYVYLLEKFDMVESFEFIFIDLCDHFFLYQMTQNY